MIVAIIYTQTGMRFMAGDHEQVMPNLETFSQEVGVAIRRAEDTELRNLGTSADPRLPSTVEEFDIKYPDTPHWSHVAMSA